MPDIPMPRLSDSMEEGTILSWLVEDGAQVARGQEIAEIETDKATMTYEADVAGVLRVAVSAGETVPVGATIATIAESVARPAPPQAAAVPHTAEAPRAADVPRTAAAAPAPGRSQNGVTASPVARRLAVRLGVELAGVTGSGPRGRIVKADVRAAAEAVVAVPDPVDAAPPPEPASTSPASVRGAGARGETTHQELSRLQQVVARRMAESKATVPHFAISMDVDMSAASSLHRELKTILDPAPSVTDLIVKAAALALRRHPRANGSYTDGRFELHRRVNVGVAVAAPDALIVPTVFDADAKSLGAIAAEVSRLAAKVRDGGVTPPELAGGTFTVSNLGMFGVDRFTGIVNPPQAGILCAGAITERPVAADGQIVVAPVMTLTLSCDHRILYGADAAQFLAEIGRLLEAPLGLHS
jgi:pyruvate dehydrogenase E2 component (dihydrolipoamide acetyltransferase)